MSIIVNSRISFVFALAFGKQVAKTIARDIRRQLPPLSPRSHELRGGPIGAAKAAFGEQNKIDNDSKCQQVYKSLKNMLTLQVICGVSFLWGGGGEKECPNDIREEWT